MTVGRILGNGKDIGSGFALATLHSKTTRIVLTAGHVIDGLEYSSLQFLIEDKRRILVERGERDDNLDVAVLHLSEDVPEGLAVGLAVGEENWQVESRPRGNDPKLTGTINATYWPLVTQSGHEVSVLQLQVDQILGDYKGYSGSPVALKSPTGAVIGVLIEQLRARLSVPTGQSKPATNILYAIPVEDVLKRFNLHDVQRAPLALEHKLSTINDEEYRIRYLRQVHQRYGTVTLPISPSDSLSLHAIFQPLALRSAPLAAEDLEYQRRRQLLGEPLEDGAVDGALSAKQRNRHLDKKISAPPVIAQHGEDALSKSPQQRIVILGGPGTGKTTTLKHLVSRYAQQALEQAQFNTASTVPLFLSLADLARSGKSFQEYLTEVVEYMGIDRGYAESLWSEIQHGNALIALDSLDEVTPRERSRMIDLVNVLALQDGNIWVVGSRFTEYKSGQLKHARFAEWELLSMTSQLRKELAAKLIPELQRTFTPGAEALPSSSDFVQLIENHTQAATWGENPLLFSLAAAVFIKKGVLPSSRSALYKEVIDAVLMLKEQDPVERKYLLRALTVLSLWLFQEKRGLIFTLDDLFTALESTLHYSSEEIKHVVRMTISSGVLDIVARETYGFRHRTFQEYLAAVELARRLIGLNEVRAKAQSLIWSKHTYSSWKEILRLMVGVLAQGAERTGQLEMVRWLQQLIELHTTDEGDPGDLGFTLALTSFAEIEGAISWDQRIAGKMAVLEAKAVSLWTEKTLEAARRGQKKRLERFQILAKDIVHLRFPGQEAIIQGLIKVLLLATDSSDVKSAVVDILETLGTWIMYDNIRLLLDNADMQVRRMAAKVLKAQGERISPDLLFPLLRDEDWYVQQQVSEALAAQGEHIPLDQLLSLLRTVDLHTRYPVVQVVSTQGERLPLDQLLPLLQDPDLWVRLSTIKLMEALGERLPLDQLLPLLQDPDSLVRRSTVEVLGAQGERTPLDQLLSLLQDSSEIVRKATVEALGKLGERIPLDRLLPLLQDTDWQVRSATVEVLGVLGEHTPLDQLLPLLQDTDWRLRHTAVKVLGERVPLDQLLPLLQDPDSMVRRSTVEVLGALGERTPLDQLVPLLRRSDHDVYNAVAQVLRTQRERLPLDQLCSLVENTHDYMGEPIIQLLRDQGERVPVDWLLSLLQNGNEYARDAAIRLLGTQEAHVSPDYLLSLLEVITPDVRVAAVQVLGAQGDISLDRLLPLLQDTDYQVRRAAAKVLEAQKELIPLDRLLPVQKYDDYEVQNAVVEVMAVQKELIPLDQLRFLLKNATLHRSDLHVGLQIHYYRDIQVSRAQSEHIPLDWLHLLLQDNDQFVRQGTVQMLGEHIPLDQLLPLLQDDSSQVRDAVVQTLRVRREHVPLTQLLSLLKDSNYNVWETVAQVLEAQKEHIPPDQLLPFLELLEHTDWQARRAAVQVLSIHRELLPLDLFLPLLKDDISFVRMATVQILGERLPLNQLLLLLRDINWRVQIVAAQALGIRGEPLPLDRFLPLLEKLSDYDQVTETARMLGESLPLDQSLLLLEHTNWLVRTETVRVLGERIPLDRLLPLLQDTDLSIRTETVRVLGERLPLEQALALLEDPASWKGARGGSLREAVIGALKKKKQLPSIPTFLPLFYHQREEVRHVATEILSLLEETVPADLLTDLLSDEEYMIRKVALDRLKKQLPAMLVDMASQADMVLDGVVAGDVFTTLTHMHVADTLGELQIASFFFLDRLTQLLDWPHWQVRLKAIKALGMIRRNIPNLTIQRLLILRRDPDPKLRFVRDAADDALAEILSLETSMEDEI